jgi:hypothetical protein
MLKKHFVPLPRREEEALRQEMEEKRNVNLKLKEEAKIAREVRQAIML